MILPQSNHVKAAERRQFLTNPYEWGAASLNIQVLWYLDTWEHLVIDLFNFFKRFCCKGKLYCWQNFIGWWWLKAAGSQSKNYCREGGKCKKSSKGGSKYWTKSWWRQWGRWGGWVKDQVSNGKKKTGSEAWTQNSRKTLLNHRAYP